MTTAAKRTTSRSRAPKTPQFIDAILSSISTMAAQKESIFRLLKNDHEKVDMLFSQIMASEDSAKRKELVEQMETELSIHAEAEEKVFYSKLKNEEPSRDSVLEGFEEHKIIKTLIAELKKSGRDQDVFNAKIKVLKEVVSHHVREEESTMFSRAREVLSSEEELEIGKKFLSAKEGMLKAL